LIVFALNLPEDAPSAEGAGAPSAAASQYPGDLWDIKSGEPGTRTSSKPAVRSDPARGAALAREIDPAGRAIRTWDIDVGRGLEIEAWRLKTIWDRTGQGCLPFDLPESIHGEEGEGTLEAVFVDRELVRQYLTAGTARFQVRLREWRG